MFSIIFEILSNKANWNDYLDNAKMLRSELEKIDGFIDNIRYRSLTREGWILSLSNWRDEKSLVRWRRTRATTKSSRRAAMRFSPTITSASARSRRTIIFPQATRSPNSVSTKPKLERERRSRL
jgi:heme-degrading monooxygenase HmoA